MTSEQLEVWRDRGRENFWTWWGIGLVIKFGIWIFDIESTWPYVIQVACATVAVLAGLAWAVAVLLLRRAGRRPQERQDAPPTR